MQNDRLAKLMLRNVSTLLEMVNNMWNAWTDTWTDLYLRLFYTDKFLGWNKEEWFSYLICSLIVVTSVGGALLLTRRYLPITSRFLPNGVVGAIALVCTPLLIILFFSAGRVSMLPLSTGVHQMPRFGCCSQALAFPHERLADVIGWYESKRVGYADSLLEVYADEHDEVRWALTPSIFQHIGHISSKYDKNSERRAVRSTWNSAFELNDPIALQVEHQRAVKSHKNPR